MTLHYIRPDQPSRTMSLDSGSLSNNIAVWHHLVGVHMIPDIPGQFFQVQLSFEAVLDVRLVASHIEVFVLNLLIDTRLHELHESSAELLLLALILVQKVQDEEETFSVFSLSCYELLERKLLDRSLQLDLIICDFVEARHTPSLDQETHLCALIGHDLFCDHIICYDTFIINPSLRDTPHLHLLS